MDQPNLYNPGAIVWLTEEACHARVEKVFRPLGDAHYRYTVETDDGDILGFIEEDRLYPSTLPPIPEEKDHGREARQAQKGKLLYFPRS